MRATWKGPKRYLSGGLEVSDRDDTILIHQIDHDDNYDQDGGISFPLEALPWLISALQSIADKQPQDTSPDTTPERTL